ncbi:M23 family metallopeptidase [Geitlerinema sp. PCC 9228]|jgi:murein DD-endopeptidase MepM/ murein hydrolase activator NlpD|uniref:M23 family metallopeptidase n=1 Tax=Geitlerinema sp. PCC 9228 TaxID=111611 RepID=UPI0009FE338A|nr:M23 family metallopeptidase [Geitlerinema sp. PCC 9228]
MLQANRLTFRLPLGRRLRGRFFWLGWGLLLGILSPAARCLALEVELTPQTPRLGETISVTIESEVPGGSPPKVIWDGTSYPAFPQADNRFRVLLPTTPLQEPGRRTLRVRDDQQVRNLAVYVRDRNFPTQSIWLSDSKASLTGTDYEFDRVAEFKQLVSPQKFWQGPFLRPHPGSVTTVYGVRRYYNGEFANNYYHRGVDYAGRRGSTVVAPAAGRVALVGRETEGFALHGNTVGIDHGQGVVSIFLHLDRIDVQPGQMVAAGEAIGTVGSTGISTGPHLHWGLYVHGRAIDPVPWRFRGIE